MSYWGTVAKRAWRETRAEVRLDSPVRVILTVFGPLGVAGGAWWLTGQLGIGALLGLGFVIVVALGTFVFKLVVTPARLDREATASIAAERARSDALIVAAAGKEQARRQALMGSLIKLYQLKSDNISPELLAGLALPPMEWINQHLAEMGESWFVVDIQGMNYQTAELNPLNGPGN